MKIKLNVLRKRHISFIWILKTIERRIRRLIIREYN